MRNETHKSVANDQWFDLEKRGKFMTMRPEVCNRKHGMRNETHEQVTNDLIWKNAGNVWPWGKTKAWEAWFVCCQLCPGLNTDYHNKSDLSDVAVKWINALGFLCPLDNCGLKWDVGVLHGSSWCGDWQSVRRLMWFVYCWGQVDYPKCIRLIVWHVMSGSSGYLLFISDSWSPLWNIDNFTS